MNRAKNFVKLPRSGFTLIEVLLAIGLTTGLLLVAMTFYRQATELRAAVFKESDRYTNARLVLERLASDLRTARERPGVADAFQGDGFSLRFARVAWMAPRVGTPGTGIVGNSDLTQVTVAATRALEGTNEVVVSLHRIEEPINHPSLLASTLNTTNAPPGSTNSQIFRVGEELSDSVRYLRFRYWDGAAWTEGWTNAAPPPGVEILLANEMPVLEANAAEYSPEVFRRVVFLPGGIARRKPELDALGFPLPP